MSLVFPTPAIHILEIAGGEASNEEQSERCTRGTVMRDEEKSKATMPPSLFSPFLSAKQTCPPLSGGEKKLIIACEIAFVATLMLFLSFQNRGLFPTFLVVSALLWQQKKSWSTVGFARPTSWRRALGAGLGLCGIWFVLQIFGLEPLVAILIHQRPDVQAFSSLHGHPLNVVGSLLIAWTSSAFGEEMLFRGYLLNRFADLFGRSYPGWTVSILAQAILFGSVHLYQGLAGALIIGVYGLGAGICYLGIRQNIWGGILAHGLTDSIAYLLMSV